MWCAPWATPYSTIISIQYKGAQCYVSPNWTAEKFNELWKTVWSQNVQLHVKWNQNKRKLETRTNKSYKKWMYNCGVPPKNFAPSSEVPSIVTCQNITRHMIKRHPFVSFPVPGMECSQTQLFRVCWHHSLSNFSVRLPSLGPGEWNRAVFATFFNGLRRFGFFGGCWIPTVTRLRPFTSITLGLFHCFSHTPVFWLASHSSKRKILSFGSRNHHWIVTEKATGYHYH